MAEAPRAALAAPCPPTYAEVAPEHASLGGGLSFVDFLPPCIKVGSFLNSAQFEPFSTLIDYANQWLRENLAWEVKTCESVEFKVKSEGVDEERMTYSEHGERRTYYVRCLRLWIVPRFDQTRPVQQLAYINLVPNHVESGGFFARPTYETLDQLISRYNGEVCLRPAPGRLLTVESHEMKDSSYSFDPDQSFWHKDGNARRNFLFVVRLFFEVGPPVSEEIGLADFVPRVTSSEGFLSFPTYEPFAAVLAHANNWCSRQSNVRFCNAQTLEIKYRGGCGVNTKEMSYTELPEANTYYIRILRVAYVNELTLGGSGYASQRPPLNLQCKTFVPVQLTKGEFPPEFETLSETKRRVEAWARTTGAHVLSCETASMRLSCSEDLWRYVDSGYTKNRGERTDHWIFTLRLYLDGQYSDPPPEEAPPVREVQEISNCCLL